jgi:putative transposase
MQQRTTKHRLKLGALAASHSYDTDLSDEQWAIIGPLFPAAKSGGKKGGRPREIDIRQVVNAILYLLKTGCPWRYLPSDFPKWRRVYDYFTAWKKDGTWKTIHDSLRDKVRLKAKKKKQPTAGIIDSQSVKTTEKGGFVAMTLVRR